MKLLLDENLPKRLKTDFPEHEVFTVRDIGWTGKKNGELMSLLIDKAFDALLTFDKNLQYQQNFNKYQLPVIVLFAPDNTYMTLKELTPEISKVLSSMLKAGATIVRL